MITLTDLNGHRREFNGYLIREIKKTPDTILVFINGNILPVRESVEEVLSKLFANPKTLDLRAMEAKL